MPRVTGRGVPVPACEPVSSGGVRPVSIAISPRGLVYVADNGSVTGGSGHVLSSFAVRGGDLTELPGSPVALPADSAPSGLVIS